MNQRIEDLTKALEEKDSLLQREREKRKAAEGALIQQKEKFKLALKEMPVIIFATDNDGSIIFFNHEFERISGYTDKDIFDNSKLTESLVLDGNADMQIEDGAQREWRFKSKDGTMKTVAWSKVSQYFPISTWESWRVGLDITELKDALAKVKVLSGLLPICASCKKIRDEKGCWNQIEFYIRERSDAEFSHGICPECAKELYPDLNLPTDESV
jgi:PAS domain S-box-containing protein